MTMLFLSYLQDLDWDLLPLVHLALDLSGKGQPSSWTWLVAHLLGNWHFACFLPSRLLLPLLTLGTQPAPPAFFEVGDSSYPFSIQNHSEIGTSYLYYTLVRSTFDPCSRPCSWSSASTAWAPLVYPGDPLLARLVHRRTLMLLGRTLDSFEIIEATVAWDCLWLILYSVVLLCWRLACLLLTRFRGFTWWL